MPFFDPSSLLPFFPPSLYLSCPPPSILPSSLSLSLILSLRQLLGIPDDPRQQNPLKRLIAGGLAGITSVTATYPLDLVRTRLSAQGEGENRKYKLVYICDAILNDVMFTSSRNVRHAFRVILKEEGGFWSGCLYRGIFPTLCGIAPYVGLNFAVYETLKGDHVSLIMPTSASACVDTCVCVCT